jgi:hypothetical protein
MGGDQRAVPSTTPACKPHTKSFLVQADICHTLQTRISLLEMGASDSGPAGGGDEPPLLETLSAAPLAFHLPRRVFFPVKVLALPLVGDREIQIFWRSSRGEGK